MLDAPEPPAPVASSRPPSPFGPAQQLTALSPHECSPENLSACDGDTVQSAMAVVRGYGVC